MSAWLPKLRMLFGKDSKYVAVAKPETCYFFAFYIIGWLAQEITPLPYTAYYTQAAFAL
jgi:hypothetical protein